MIIGQGGTARILTLSSAVAAFAPPAGPVIAVLPVVSGTVQPGQTLTLATLPTWEGTPLTEGYIWQVDGVDISGETGTTFVVPATPGLKYRVRAYATNAAGSTNRYSNALTLPLAQIDATQLEVPSDNLAVDIADRVTGYYATLGATGANVDSFVGTTLTMTSTIALSTVTLTATNAAGANAVAFNVNVSVADSIPPELSNVDATVANTLSLDVSEIATLYYLVDSNATRTAAQVKTGGGDLSGNFPLEEGSNTDPIDMTGLASGDYYLHLMAEDPSGNQSVVTTEAITIAAGNSTDANVNSVAATGWEIDYTSPPTFDPVGDPLYVVVNRDGYDSAGSPTTVVDDLLIMKRERQPYPSQASLTASTAVLSDFVYADDTITGVTNNSTRAYPKPICQWLDHDMQVVTDQSYTAKLAVAHHHARSGRPVAAVKFTASDGTTTLEQTITSMTSTTFSASGLTVPHFEATFDFSTLDDDALITIDAVIYPWVGTAFTASTDGATYPSINFCEMKVLNLSTEAAYAYVDTAGNDGTGVVSNTPATAAANPYLTVAGAAAAIKTFNNSNYGRNNSGGGIIRVNAGTFTHSIFLSLEAMDWPLIIEASNAANKATTIYQDAGANTSNSIPLRVGFRNMTIKGTGGFIFLDTSAGAGTVNMVSMEGCDFDTPSVLWGAWIYRVGRFYMVNCGGDDSGSTAHFSTNRKESNIVGCLNQSGSTVYNSAGCLHNGSSVADTQIGTGNRVAQSGIFVGFNQLALSSTSANVINYQLAVGAPGVAIIGNVFEDRDGTTAALAQLWGDSNQQAIDNVLLQCNTFMGQRTNLGYLDTGTNVDKYAQIRFNVFDLYNTKGDVFETDATYIGNWPLIHKVGAHSNAYLRGDSNGASTPGAGTWLGELLAIGDVSGSSGTPLVADFVDDRSFRGTGAGGGDYTPGASNALPVIPAGLAPYNVDQKGRAIANDGSALAGAIQAAP